MSGCVSGGFWVVQCLFCRKGGRREGGGREEGGEIISKNLKGDVGI